MYLYKEYIKVGDKEIKCTISFNKDATNWVTSQPKKIGYQVTCVPVKRSNRDGICIEEFGAFTGFNDCLLEVDRQSKKRLEKAISILNERKDKYLAYFND